MSGSDAPSGSGAWPPSGSESLDCASLRLVRVLQSPVPGVADALTIRDVLHVTLRPGPPELVIASDDREQDAGGILPTSALLECLRRGVEFIGEVLRADGGAIELEVRARDCRTLRRLATVRPEGEGVLHSDAVLRVSLRDERPDRIDLIDGFGVVVGTIPFDAALVECFQGGTSFDATVVPVADGDFAQVVIRPAT